MSQARVAIRNGSVRGRGEATKKGSHVMISLPPVIKKSCKSRSFHFRYMELCRAKNLTPVPDIRSKSNAIHLLDLCGDKLGVNEWLLIIESLHHDQVLQILTVRMRRSHINNVVEPIDTEKRARLYRQKPVIYTRFIFGGLVEAIANCVEFNKNLSVLKLEGLPLQDKYIEYIAKALASNECLKELSFHKSYIGDKGCESVCSTVKYLNRVEKFDISDCNITAKGAEFVADMIRMQKITRFSEGWEKSLRYRSVDINSISGLRTICLANNPGIGDEGVKLVTEVLKEDAWVKTMDMECCGLTDRGANYILTCLDLNNSITEFNVRNNEAISKILLRSIRDHFGQEDEDKVQEPQYDLSNINGLQSLPKNKKYSMCQLLVHTKTLEEQLSFERMLRKKAEKLNEKLNHQLMSFENNLRPESIDTGIGLAHNESVPSIKDTQNYRQMHFSQLVNSRASSPDATPRSEQITLRKGDKDQKDSEMTKRTEQSFTSEMESSSMAAVAAATAEARKPLKVRKVRSEMKYVEPNVQENPKKHESKSDHEFANERDFKLVPMVQFETDIGDSVMVNNNSNRDGANGIEMRYNSASYEQDLLKIRDFCAYKTGMGDVGIQRKSAHFESGYIGDGVNVSTNRRLHNAEQRRNTNNNQIEVSDGRVGNTNQLIGHVAQYMADLDRRGAAMKTKKRNKTKVTLDSCIGDGREDMVNKHSDAGSTEETYMQVVADVNVDTYMNDYVDVDVISMDSTLVNSDSDINAAMSHGSRGKYTPMQVFMRRKGSDLSQEEADSQVDEEENDEEAHLSPHSTYLDFQRQRNDKTK